MDTVLDHGSGLFDAHDIASIAYQTPQFGFSSRTKTRALLDMLGWKPSSSEAQR